ncbi:MAG: DMT family transporter, partial [Pseudomonadota bacterium]
MQPRPERPLIGLCWMVVAGLSFVALTAVVKHLGSALPVIETAFLRFLFGLVFLAPVVITLFRTRVPRGIIRFCWLRALAHTGSVFLWFYAMTQITIAEVTSLNYLTPVYVTAGAAIFLGERLALRRIVAVLVALIGAMVILRPGFRDLSDGHFAILGASICLATSYLMAKRLSTELEPGQVVALLTLMVTALLAPAALWVWEWPTLVELGWVIVVAGFASAGHYAMSRAFAEAPAAVVQPATFLQLVWAILLGWVVFNEEIDGWVVLGGAMIFASVCFIAWREFV